jgi:hypothetical protein
MAKEGAKKILRVGIIQGGRIVEERLIRKREDVALGTHAKNTFILPTSQLGKSYRLFEAKSEAYLLNFDDRMEGRLSLNEQVVDLSALAKSGNLKKRGGRYQVELDDRSRGKVVIGEFTLLFQFVEKPPVLPRPQLPAAARGGLAQRVDWLMFNVLLASFLVQAGLGIGLDIWWRSSGQYLRQEFGAKKTRAYELLKAEVLAEKKKKEEKDPEPDPEPDDAQEDDADPDPDPKPEAKKPVEKVRPREPVKAEQPQKRTASRIKELKANVTKKTFLHALGSLGDGEGGIANTLAKGLASSALDDAFNNLDGGVANADGSTKTFVGEPSAVKSGKGAYKGIGKAEAGGSRIKTGAVKSKGKSAGGEIKVKLKVRGGSVSGQSGSGKVDKGAVKKVFRRRSGAIKHCYEKALKTNPNLKGKVTIRFRIGTAGRITNIKVTKNTTGSSSIGSCITSKVKSWRFPSPEGGPVTFSYPFILAKG